MDAALDSAISNIEETAAQRDRYADWRDQVRSSVFDDCIILSDYALVVF